MNTSARRIRAGRRGGWLVMAVWGMGAAVSMAGEPQPDGPAGNPAAVASMTVRWEGDTAVYEADGWQLRIAYLFKGTRSEGQEGCLLHQGQPVEPSVPGEVRDTPVGILKHYGTERPWNWSNSGWNFAGREQIQRSEQVVPTAVLAEPAARVVFTPEGPESRIELEAGQALRILLKESAGTGYHWALAEGEARATDVLRREGEGPAEPLGDPGRLGGPVGIPFDFTAVAAGEVSLRFALQRPFEKDVPPEEEIVVRVLVK